MNSRPPAPATRVLPQSFTWPPLLAPSNDDEMKDDASSDSGLGPKCDWPTQRLSISALFPVHCVRSSEVSWEQVWDEMDNELRPAPALCSCERGGNAAPVNVVNNNVWRLLSAERGGNQ